MNPKDLASAVSETNESEISDTSRALPSMSDTTISIPVDTLPEAKTWEPGQEYTIKVIVNSLDDDMASFSVVGAETPEQPIAPATNEQ